MSSYGIKMGQRKTAPVAPGYLTYGYDEFGSDLYRELEESGIPSPYDRQGEEQPFGYTGYRYDDISGTYFAQAREYQPQSGRFTAEDVVKGNGAVLETLNRYGYCWGNPVGLVDHNGEYPIWTTVGEYIGNTVRDLGGTGEKSSCDRYLRIVFGSVPVSLAISLIRYPQLLKSLI